MSESCMEKGLCDRNFSKRHSPRCDRHAQADEHLEDLKQ